jgi:hypothetical protein
MHSAARTAEWGSAQDEIVLSSGSLFATNNPQECFSMFMGKGLV